MRIRSACILAGGMLFSSGCGSELDLVSRTLVDTFVQRPDDAVDILFVVDDSTSMAEEQDALAAGFGAFADELEAANTEVHLGVITTSQDSDDPRRGHLVGNPPVLGVDDDHVALFRERVQVGVGGSDKEKGLEAAWLAVSEEAQAGPNAGFLRDEAHLLVVFVTDEDDCSDAGALDGLDSQRCYTDQDQLVAPEAVVAHLWQVKGDDPSKVSVGAIIAPEQRTCEDGWYGSRYARVVQMAGGFLGDICSSDWSSMLQDLGLTATGVFTQFELSAAADPATLAVHVDEVPVLEDPEHGWTYDPSLWRISFHGDAVPPRGSVVTVAYTALAGERIE